MKCFLDLDGVLVNFVGGASRFHRRANPYTRPESLGQWDCVKLLGMTEEEFWPGLDFHFWRLLDWMPDGKEILEEVEAAFSPENVCLLTSPSDNVGAVEGKRAWVKRELPGYFDRLLVGRAKEFMASPQRVLVDDYPVNIEKFEAAGGIGLLVPRPWNHRHGQDAVTSVRYELQAAKD